MGSVDEAAKRSRELYERLARRLAEYRDILDRQHQAILKGAPRRVAELAHLECQAARDIEALYRSVSATAAPPGAPDPHLSHCAELREEALRANRRNRELLARELVGVRRMITTRRLRLGTPSVYANAGGATLIDVRS